MPEHEHAREEGEDSRAGDSERQARAALRVPALSEAGLKAFLARRIVLAHGGVLARFSANGAVSFAMVLPRIAPEDPQPETQR